MLNMSVIAMNTAIQRFTVGLFFSSIVLFSIVSCDSPTEPETIQNLTEISFVESDHWSLCSTYRSSDYAYVTLCDQVDPDDPSVIVEFISAIGDTEQVKLHGVTIPSVLPAELSSLGAGIYLQGVPGSAPGDGVLYVGAEMTTIQAHYFSRYLQVEVEATANVRPGAYR